MEHECTIKPEHLTPDTSLKTFIQNPSLPPTDLIKDHANELSTQTSKLMTKVGSISTDLNNPQETLTNLQKHSLRLLNELQYDPDHQSKIQLISELRKQVELVARFQGFNEDNTQKDFKEFIQNNLIKNFIKQK